MTVSLTGTGGAFARLGACGQFLNNCLGLLGDTATDTAAKWGASGPLITPMGTNIANIFAQFVSNEQGDMAGLYPLRDTLRSSAFQALTSFLQTQCAAFVVDQVNRDVTLTPDQNSLAGALAELVRQMTNSSDSIKKPTITITPANGTPTPTGTLVLVGTVLGKDGVQSDMIFNETADCVCTTDSYTGGATAGQEAFSLAGDNAVGLLDWNWPQGSGGLTSLTACSPLTSSTNSLLANGGFDTYSVANTPDSWTISVGAAGTNVFSSSDTYGSGTSSLKITGVGTTATALYQAITTPTAGQVLALNAFVHVDGTAPAAGKLAFELMDSTGTIITDDAGNANRYTVDLTQASLQTTYVATGKMTTTQLNGASVAGGAGTVLFRMPKTWVPGATVRVQIRLSTVITATYSVFVDHLALTPAVQMYGSGIGGGPYAALFSGATNAVLADRLKFTIANNYGSQWAKFLHRIFNLPGLNLQFGSAASPTITEASILGY